MEHKIVLKDRSSRVIPIKLQERPEGARSSRVVGLSSNITVTGPPRNPPASVHDRHSHALRGEPGFQGALDTAPVGYEAVMGLHSGGYDRP